MSTVLIHIYTSSICTVTTDLDNEGGTVLKGMGVNHRSKTEEN